MYKKQQILRTAVALTAEDGQVIPQDSRVIVVKMVGANQVQIRTSDGHRATVDVTSFAKTFRGRPPKKS